MIAAFLQNVYKKANPLEKESLMTTYQGHQPRKELTRQHKAINQQRAIKNPDSMRSIIFDLQKVLPAPQMKV